MSNERTIVDDAGFYVGVSEHVFIIGNNGSGKTSILKTILGEQELSYSGDIVISPGIQMGYLPQIINFKDDGNRYWIISSMKLALAKRKHVLFFFFFALALIKIML